MELLFLEIHAEVVFDFLYSEENSMSIRKVISIIFFNLLIEKKCIIAFKV